MLTNETITFGKYKGAKAALMLRDRSYCDWLLNQDWFKNSYEFLYNCVKDWNPSIYFLNKEQEDEENTEEDFMSNYIYFNLTSPESLMIELSSVDMTCYVYYISMINEIKDKIYNRLENDEENIYDIKAPVNWLKKFEKECGIPREDFKNFLIAYELPNLPYIIERIKQEGGITYNGANSFKIAKSRSLQQEAWWEELLKNKYGEKLGAQFKYDKCIFDFICIDTKTIFECKLGLKDFDEAQHKKYIVALREFRIIYLISTDCVIDIERKVIYTTNTDKYSLYLHEIPLMKESSYLDDIIKNFDVELCENLSSLFGK